MSYGEAGDAFMRIVNGLVAGIQRSMLVAISALIFALIATGVAFVLKYDTNERLEALELIHRYDR